jgi:hypothetical protein
MTESLNSGKLLGLLQKLYREDADNIRRRLMEKRDEIARDRCAAYSKKYDDPQQYAQADANAFFTDTIVRLILDKCDYRVSQYLDEDEQHMVQSFVSKKPRIVLMFDDVTSEFSGLLSRKGKVTYNDVTMECSHAFRQLLIDIFTRGRHYAFVCMFTHLLDIIFDKSLLQQIVMMDDSAVQKVTMAKTFPEEARRIITACRNVVFDSRYQYFFLCVNVIDGGKACVGKAETYTSAKKVVFDMLNERYIRIYDTLDAGATAAAAKEDNLANVASAIESSPTIELL